MHIAIVGYGRLGRAIHAHARKDPSNNVTTIDPREEDADFKSISRESMEDIRVCVDCSSPDSAIKNIEDYIRFKKNCVIATTGWYSEIDRVERMVKESGIGLVWSPNYSLGASIFLRLVESAATIMSGLRNYDVYCREIHHNIKKDSPSGNARIIGDALLRNMSRKSSVVYETLNRQIHEQEINFTSVRGGFSAGIHSVYFESECDVVMLEHNMKTKDGLATGALLAVKWIADRRGMYSMYDLVDFLLEKGAEESAVNN